MKNMGLCLCIFILVIHHLEGKSYLTQQALIFEGMNERFYFEVLSIKRMPHKIWVNIGINKTGKKNIFKILRSVK